MKFVAQCSRALAVSTLLGATAAQAQDIPKGCDLMAELGQGFSHPKGGDAFYLATLQLVPQVTVVPDNLRAGLVLGAVYPGTKVGGLVGVRGTFKLFNGSAFMLAQAFHVNLQGEYLPWVYSGDGWRQWLGGGIGIETGNVISLNFRVHRDFQTPATYGQMAVAFNFAFKRVLPPIDP